MTEREKRRTYGVGLLKGLQVTLRHLLSRSVTVHYPDEKPILPPRSRGVIALKEENCTVCMLCARECPDWCIYIEGHKEERKPKQEGKRAKKYNVLDRFAIDYALCMYCGICVEVCPYDALFWTPEFEYAEHDVTNLTHEMEKLSDWMYTVLPPPPLDDGALGPEFKSLAERASAAPSTAAPPTPAPEAPAAPSTAA
ncbi:MAG: NuoI/complex I 23 kDa subunit family protein, partial [Actinomycetota bacterium]